MVSADGFSLDARSTPRAYYGWWVVLVAAAAMVGTLPGRTQGLGLITEPLLRDLGLDRVTYAQLNLWGTLAGALFGIGIGRLMDRFGARSVLTSVCGVLGAIVCVMAQVHSVPALAVSITLTRGFGQSALSVISIATVGHWFVRRIDAAMAVFSIALSIGFMAAFPAVGWLVQSRGWRAAWLAIGLSLLFGLAPLCWLVVRRTPADLGLEPDGGKGVRPGSDPFGQIVRTDSDSGVSWKTAIGQPAFWVFALGTALYGLVASGIGLFNESILAERQFGPEVYYQTLAVTAMTGLAGNFLGGLLATKVPLKRLLAASLFTLAGGLAILPHVTTITQVMIWAAAMGIGGGILMVLFFSVWPRMYGRRDLGRIQGAAQALTVVASAIGPLLLALCVTWTGSYAVMFRVLAVIVAVNGVAAARSEREDVMTIDRYTKCVLTVIAGCLLWMCVMGSGAPLSAQARQRALTATNVQPVILVGTGTMDAAGTVTVNFTSEPGARDVTDPTVPVALSYTATKPLPVSLPYSASKPLPALLTYSPREPLPVEIASVKKTGEWEPLRAAVEDAPLRRQPGMGKQ